MPKYDEGFILFNYWNQINAFVFKLANKMRREKSGFFEKKLFGLK